MQMQCIWREYDPSIADATALRLMLHTLARVDQVFANKDHTIIVCEGKVVVIVSNNYKHCNACLLSFSPCWVNWDNTNVSIGWISVHDIEKIISYWWYCFHQCLLKSNFLFCLSWLLDTYLNRWRHAHHCGHRIVVDWEEVYPFMRESWSYWRYRCG